MTTHRGDLTDAQWEKLKPLLPPQQGHTGIPAKDHRRMINGILWIQRTGALWDELPTRYGPRGTLSSRFYRWQQQGIWQRIWTQLQQQANSAKQIDWAVDFGDSTIGRAHTHTLQEQKGAANRSTSAFWQK